MRMYSIVVYFVILPWWRDFIFFPSVRINNNFYVAGTFFCNQHGNCIPLCGVLGCFLNAFILDLYLRSDLFWAKSQAQIMDCTFSGEEEEGRSFPFSFLLETKEKEMVSRIKTRNQVFYSCFLLTIDSIFLTHLDFIMPK